MTRKSAKRKRSRKAASVQAERQRSSSATELPSEPKPTDLDEPDPVVRPTLSVLALPRSITFTSWLAATVAVTLFYLVLKMFAMNVYAGDEHAWILDFCELCRRCIRDCPPDAFYDSPINHENGLVTVLDNKKCFPYFVTYHGCSICIKVCPFNQESYQKIKAGFLGT